MFLTKIWFIIYESKIIRSKHEIWLRVETYVACAQFDIVAAADIAFVEMRAAWDQTHCLDQASKEIYLSNFSQFIESNEQLETVFLIRYHTVDMRYHTPFVP